MYMLCESTTRLQFDNFYVPSSMNEKWNSRLSSSLSSQGTTLACWL